MAISSINFSHTAYTDKNNKYNSTSVNKAIGAGVGIASASYVGYNLSKGGKECLNLFSSNLETIKATIVKIMPQIPEEDIEPIINNLPKLTNKITKITSGVLSSVLALACIGIGALADAGINKYRSHKADKNATVGNKTAQPTATNNQE